MIGIVAFLLSGCTMDRLTPSAVAQIKQVAVISTVGSKLNLTEVALTAFGNDLNVGEIGDWGLDQQIINRVTKDLQSRYKVVPATYNPADFDSGNFTEFVGGGIDTWAPLGELIRKHVANNPRMAAVDAYLVVIPTQSSIENTNQVTDGLGVVRHYLIFGHHYILHALYDLIVIDGRTFKPLRRAGERQHVFGEVWTTPPVYGPSKLVDESYWASTYAALSPAARQKIRDGLMSLIDSTMTGYVQRSGLIP
jgi:hypothetical protein